MPLYEFSCECGRRQEKIQSFDESPPICCGKSMKRGTGSISLFRFTTPLNVPTLPHRNDSAKLSAAATKGWMANQYEGVA